MTAPDTTTEDAPPPPPSTPWAGETMGLIDWLLHASYRARGAWAFQFVEVGDGVAKVAMRVVPDTFTREMAVTMPTEPDMGAWSALILRLRDAATEHDARLGQRWTAGPMRRTERGVVTKLVPVGA